VRLFRADAVYVFENVFSTDAEGDFVVEGVDPGLNVFEDECAIDVVALIDADANLVSLTDCDLGVDEDRETVKLLDHPELAVQEEESDTVSASEMVNVGEPLADTASVGVRVSVELQEALVFERRRLRVPVVDAD
jgi:hypothetical protein